MPHTNITFTRAALASLFEVFRPSPDGEEPRTGGPLGPISNPAVIGRPPDDGTEVSPRSPWGPIIRRAFLPLLAPGEPIPWKGGPGDTIGINPQPLPPRWPLIALLAKAVGDHLESGIIFVGGMDPEQKEKSLSHAKSLVSRMIDDCGNGKLFPWKPRPGLILPDGGDPGWGAEVVIFGLALERQAAAVTDADLRDLLQEAAGILIEQGAERLNGQTAKAS